MRIVQQSSTMLDQVDFVQLCKKIELAGRTAYKSEGRITEDSYKKFIKMIIKLGHESVLEHGSLSVRLVTNRAIANELVRHRIASYTQESTRYVKYNGAMEFIMPITDCYTLQSDFYLHFQEAESFYHAMVERGIKPEVARDCLPLALKTEIVVTMNIRSWRHFFKLRTHKTAHPQIRQLANLVLAGFRKECEILWEGI